MVELCDGRRTFLEARVFEYALENVRRYCAQRVVVGIVMDGYGGAGEESRAVWKHRRRPRIETKDANERLANEIPAVINRKFVEVRFLFVLVYLDGYKSVDVETR